MKQHIIISILLIFIFVMATSSISIRNELGDVKSKSELGKKLFFDPILSEDKSISCASCHKPEFAFSDNRAFSLGVDDSVGIRNAPSIMNMLSRPYFFYDGRSPTLEDQVITPIESPIEMNLSYDIAVQRIQSNEEYKFLFKEIYQSKPDSFNIANAIAEFQRSLESDGSAPHDIWLNDIDTSAMSASQQRGREMFISDEFKCFDCHFGPDFTGDEFRNIGLYDGETLLDKGRFDQTKDSTDLGKFKVPGLRNIGLTAPYMHNGMMQTLEEVMDYYSNPYDFVKTPINTDSVMVEPLNLTDQQKEDFVNFLHSLTDDNLPHQGELK